MTVLFVPRSTWYTGTPINNSGTPRPKLAPLRPQMTRHYTGSPTSTKASTWAAKDWMPLLQSIAINRQPNPASFEYNYVIPPRADGSAQIWEYAGTFQAAHSAGENDVAVGVLFAIGVNNHPSYSTYDPTRPTQWEPLTDPMVDAYRYLRDEILIPQGVVVPAVEEIDHHNMPGAATACPGVAVIGRHVDLNQPWAGTTPIPTPIPPEEPPVVTYFKTAPDSLTIWGSSDGLNAVRLEEFTVKARGIDVFAVKALPAGEADKYVYQAGLTAQSVK